MARDLDTEQQARVFKALADPTRLRMVQLLSAQKEMSGTEIAESVGISMAMLCHHWSVLTDAGVIRKRKEGQSTYVSLDRDLLDRCLGMLAPSKG